ncbi:MAG: ribose-phosphate pyrophosphokinase-like domain-containing protein, partial [Lachnospiraceae bacterium]|nr:ribose-phosphate pyrophosphokinase-like domain-containing protein [Lachnospiraceae bacterium]
MPDFQKLDTTIPVAPLKLVVMDSARELGDSINKDLIDIRKHKHHMPKDEITFKGYLQEDYRLKFSTDRFDSGEAKATLLESARGQDIYLITDVMNHSISYQMYGFTNYKSPDDHYQDMKRVIGAIAGIAKRINIIMPFMYESRQHKRSGRESLDCAVMIRELKDMGIANFITFDAHDPRVANSAPLGGFDSFLASYQFLKALLYNIDDLIVDKEHLTVISPDEG